MKTIKLKTLFTAMFVSVALTACGGSSSSGTPPANNPPADNPPADNPPADNPPADNPPADNPPADNPPADNPPADNPPADNPPADNPPADNPPEDNPPADNPPDWNAPTISLNGSKAVKVKRGATYTDAGATALDNEDGDITSDIVVGGDTVNTSLSGSYTLTYNVQDNAGNAAAEETRSVRVADYGAIDTSFQNNGATPPVSSGTRDTGKAVIQDSQGNLYVIGSRYQNRNFNGRYGYTNNDVLVLKYKDNGDLDTTFNSNGEFFYDGENTVAEKNEQQIGLAAVMDASGNLYVAAGGNNPSDQNFLVLKIKADGTLDTNFDGDGVARFSLKGRHVLPKSIVLDSNGDILIAAQYDSSRGAVIAKFDGSDGSLDTTFGAGHTGYILSTVMPYAYAMTVDSNDKILLAGSRHDGANKAMLARFTADGDLDTTFGTGRGSSEWFPSAYTSTLFQGVLVDDNNNIYASVQAADSTTGNQDIVVVKFAADGKSLDSNFGSSGAAISPTTLNPRISWLNINSMVMGSDGMVYVGGMHKVGAEYNTLIVAFNADGSTADHFGAGGYMTKDLISGHNDRIYGLVVDDTNNRVYATGHYTESSNFYKAFLMRLYN